LNQTGAVSSVAISGCRQKGVSVGLIRLCSKPLNLLSERPLLSAGVFRLSFPHHVHRFGAARPSSALLQLRRDCGALLLSHVHRYEQDPIRQSGSGGSLNVSPVGTQSGCLAPVPEKAWGAMDPVTSGSIMVSNF